jgi:acyl-CoA synthetase (AMP-forming)/AMP-acid ligase II
MEWLIERFKTSPDELAFIHEGRIVTYGDVVRLINHFRNRILSSGIVAGEAVVVLGDYSPEVFCVLIALCCNKCIVIPLTKSSVVEESTALEISGCDWYMQFDNAGSDVAINYQGKPSRNSLLIKFQKRGSPGLVLFSSGSTGKPKAILHDFNLISGKFLKVRPPTITIPFLLMDHFGGINTILGIVSSLGTVVTVTDRSVDKICAAIEKYAVELLPATPSFLNLLMASNLRNKYDLSSLKRITYGTEVMPQNLLNRVRAAFPSVSLLQTYGLSEVGVLGSKSREDGSIWLRLGGDGFEIKVVDGVLWIRSKFAMIGYLNAPSEFDEEGWFNTQDQVEVDGEYFRILGRVTDLINVAGQKVYPAEVEDVILDENNIQDVAVYGERHAILGNIVVAKIRLNTPESAENIKVRVRKACLKKLASYKAPSKVVITNEPLYGARQKKNRSKNFKN